MPSLSRPRKGSLQFYPRKRAAKFTPSVNWNSLKNYSPEADSILGILGYKVGMASAIIKDNTEHSITKGKRVTIPVTILEIPPMKIFSIRFYKDSQPVKEIVVSADKDLKRTLKLPKSPKELEKNTPAPEEYDDIRLILYSLTKDAKIKKKPDLLEVAIHATDKLVFAKSLIGKKISLNEFAEKSLLDVKGLTRGKGTQGPVKRFGISFKSHKSEKGRRNPGSLAPWHPAYVTFRTPMGGQLGLFTRTHYNFKIIDSGNIAEKDINPKSGFKKYGNINTSYIVVKGSIQGPTKRQIILTPAQRPTKKQAKQDYELVEVITQ